METKIYIEGNLSENDQIVCPLQSSVVLFVSQYCQNERFSIVFVAMSEDKHSNFLNCCKYEKKIFAGVNVEFVTWDKVPEEVKRVSLPSINQPDMKLVRSGLCVVLRYIIKKAHDSSPSFKLIDLLGFRCGSMKMCSEVSSWTKLCEVDLPMSVTQLITTLRNHTKTQMDQTSITLPNDLMKLEGHFMKKCKIHNDDKKRRAELVRLKQYFSVFDGSGIAESNGECHSGNDFAAKDTDTVKLDALSLSTNELYIEQTVTLDHGIRKFRVKKMTDKKETEQECEETVKQPIHSHHIANEKTFPSASSNSSQVAFDMTELKNALDTLNYMDIEYVHVYSEGVEMTVADVILFTYIYHMLEGTDFDCHSLSALLPCVTKWASHMASLPTVSQVGFDLGWQMETMRKALSLGFPFNRGGEGQDVIEKEAVLLFKCDEVCDDEEDVELSRNIKMKFKALKPEVIQALNKFENLGIKPLQGRHPKGQDVQVDWSSLPEGVNPKQGDVPVKRTVRKCQQLENLTTAIQAIAKPGDIVVDFCSGGGHLGIVLAYLLPKCQVMLVENKEESLLKSCSRLKSLGLTNVTLYQCNMDYFIGKFDIGTCLHACGSATDMVLELCLQSQASFVICPCCYGGIHNTHLLSYPRSQHFNEANVTYKDFLTLGHAADQTEFNIALEEQGRMCMSLIDTDRAHYAKELDYTVSLCSLIPLNCTPKNNLLIGSPN